MSIITATRPGTWTGCTPPQPHERMAGYSPRHADAMRQHANASAAAPRATVFGDHITLTHTEHVRLSPSRFRSRAASEASRSPA